jgi:hypothetical protein
MLKKDKFDLTIGEIFAIETQIAVLRSFPTLPMDLANNINMNWPIVKKLTKAHNEKVELIDERAKDRAAIIEKDKEDGKPLNPEHATAEKKDQEEREKLNKVKFTKLELNTVSASDFKDDEGKTIQITGDKQVAQSENRVMVFAYRDAYFFLEEMGLIVQSTESPGPKKP